MSKHIKNPAAVELGRIGGKAGTGTSKARPYKQARAAALERWRKENEKKSLAKGDIHSNE